MARSATRRTRSSSSDSARTASTRAGASRAARSTSTTSSRRSSPRKRSRSRRKSLRRRSDHGTRRDGPGIAQPGDFEEDGGAPGGRGLHAREARRLEDRAAREVHPEERGGEGPQEARSRPAGAEARAEERAGEASPARPEGRREGGGGGARDAPDDPGEGAPAHVGGAGDRRRTQGDRAMAPAIRHG